MATMETLTKHQKKDIRLIGKFVEVYCMGRHGRVERAPFSLPPGLGERRLCPECSAFMEYAVARRMKCTLAGKGAGDHGLLRQKADAAGAA